MPANSILDQLAQAVADRIPGATRGLVNSDVTVYVSLFEPEDVTSFGAISGTATINVERAIDLSAQGIDWSLTGIDAIMLETATDIMQLVMSATDPTFGGLATSPPVPSYEPSVRDPGSDYAGVLVSFEIPVAWDYANPATKNNVP